MTKKQLIIEKASELFAKHGIEATSVQQITDYCGISKGAFYLVFKSKDELIITLIDQFLMQFITDIDYLVNNIEDKEKLLYEFYYYSYQHFQKHSDFAKVFINEQMHSVNEELIKRIHYYTRELEKILLTMIERIYGDMVHQTKFDLMYCIKNFMNMYTELIIYYRVTLDLHLLCQSLVEKTHLLARNIRIPFVTEEIQMTRDFGNEKVTKELLLTIIDKKLIEIEEPIEKESLILLRQHLLEPTLNRAIVKGLIENLHNHPFCKWLSYLLRNYFEF